jgi:outer membrane protein TolC
MRKLGSIVLLCALGLTAEVRTLTLLEAVELALKQNPEVALARLDERKAAESVRLARDAFIPKVIAGSGLAYSNGMPMSIQGASPSVVQAQAVGSVFDRSRSYLVAQARENVRGAVLDTTARKQEVGLRAALLFLDAERMRRSAEAARHQVESLERVGETMRARVAEHRELPIESKRAALNLARGRERLQAFESDALFAGTSLAVVLGFSADDRVQPAAEERKIAATAASEQEAVMAALKDNVEVRRLESALAARTLEMRSYQAERLPKLDLVAQYGLLAKFNNYDDYFRKFQRHNGQLGVSIQIPVFAGTGTSARVGQASAEMARLRLEMGALRNRLSLDASRGWHEVKKAEASREVARLDHEVARDQVAVLLAQMEEGRASLKQVEEARFAENDKWLAFLDTHYGVERARLNLLKQSGDLLAALRQ